MKRSFVNLPWDRKRLACTKREARKPNEAGETPAVPGKSIRNWALPGFLAFSLCLQLLWTIGVTSTREVLVREGHKLLHDR